MIAKIVVFSGLLVLAASIPVRVLQTLQSGSVSGTVPIVSQASDIHPDGSFQWNFESADGSSQQQAGQLKQIGQEVGQAVQGSYSWTDPEGNQHQLKYVADENGFQPQSSDLPVAPVGPEIPPAILRSLEWIAAHPQPENQQ